MDRMKVLWLSDKPILRNDRAGSGSWVSALAWALVENFEVELCGITRGKVPHPLIRREAPIREWTLPVSSNLLAGSDRLPRRLVKETIRIIEDFAPDLIHVWGVESPWGLLSARYLIKPPALLEMQGLMSAIAPVFAGGLTIREQLACIGIREVVRGATIPQVSRRFEKWGHCEREMITGHRFINVQSTWMKAQIKSINPTCRTFDTDVAIREPFFTRPMQKVDKENTILCSLAYPAPFKGLHVAVRATAALKSRFPDIQLKITGIQQLKGLRRNGYIRWVKREAEKLGISADVIWLGKQNATQIIEELHRASVILIPSYIESYSVVATEAALRDVPIVASYAGGIPFLFGDGEAALYFSPGDVATCAHQIERLLTNSQLANRIAAQARQTARVRNDPIRIARRQLDTYRQILVLARP